MAYSASSLNISRISPSRGRPIAAALVVGMLAVMSCRPSSCQEDSDLLAGIELPEVGTAAPKAGEAASRGPRLYLGSEALEIVVPEAESGEDELVAQIALQEGALVAPRDVSLKKALYTLAQKARASEDTPVTTLRLFVDRRAEPATVRALLEAIDGSAFESIVWMGRRGGDDGSLREVSMRSGGAECEAPESETGGRDAPIEICDRCPERVGSDERPIGDRCDMPVVTALESGLLVEFVEVAPGRLACAKPAPDDAPRTVTRAPERACPSVGLGEGGRLAPGELGAILEGWRRRGPVCSTAIVGADPQADWTLLVEAAAELRANEAVETVRLSATGHSPAELELVCAAAQTPR
jgi:hypothetical protein